MTNEQLYSKYQATGCQGCFSRLYERYHERVVTRIRRSYRILSGDADDVSQDVWACVSKRGQMFQIGWTFEGWLFEVTRRKSIDAKRKQKRESNHSETLRHIDTGRQADMSVEERVIFEETSCRLLDAISELPKASAEAIRMTAFEGLTVIETAFRFRISEQAMRKRLTLAKNFLKDAVA